MTTTAFLSKPDVRQRLKTTRLRTSDSSITLVKWTPEDDHTPIFWQTTPTPVGEILIAATTKGICFLGFTNPDKPSPAPLTDLHHRFPTNPISQRSTPIHQAAIRRINMSRQELPVHLHLKGTPFQLNIWTKLLLVPFGGLVTYSDLGNGPKNARATGTAVGANPVGLIVPCHRAVRADGTYDAYYWGPQRKKIILAYEALITEK